MNADKTIKLGDITVLNCEGVEFDDVIRNPPSQNKEYNALHRSIGTVTVRKIQNGKCVMDDNTCAYTSAGYANRETTAAETWGWGANKTVELNVGEGFVVNNQQGAVVYFRVAGEVDVTPIIPIPTGWSVHGNDTPCDMTLGDIKVLNCEGVEFDDVIRNPPSQNKEYNALHRSIGTVTVRKIQNGKCVMDDNTCAYTSAGYANRETTAAETWGWGGNKDVTLAAGEAFVVNNQQGAMVYFELKKPIED